MSSQFQVDTQQIQVSSHEIQRISQEIESNVALMMQRLTALQDAWRGSASVGFQQAVATWTATQRQVRTALDGIQVSLSRAGEQYAQVEAANAALFRG